MAESGESTGEKPSHPGAGLLLALGVALLALTLLTYLLSRLPHGSWSLPVALGIAVVKAVLIALWYMHLLEQKGSNGLVALTGVVFLVVLLVVTVLETSTRFRPATPPGPFKVRELPGLEPAPPPSEGLP